MALRMFIVAGEASGDALGANLIRALNSKWRGIAFTGVGGERMRSAGLQKDMHAMDGLSVMGYNDVLGSLPSLFKLKKTLVSAVIESRPHAVIFIDSKGFSQRVAKDVTRYFRRNKDARPALFQYAAPSIWGLKTADYRAQRFAALYDEMFLLFPFEEEHWRRIGVENVTVVGPPILDHRNVKLDAETKAKARSELRNLMQVPQDETVVCLLPGSRQAEVHRNMPIFCKALETVATNRPNPFRIGNSYSADSNVISPVPFLSLQVDCPHIVLPCASPVKPLVQNYLSKFPTLKVTVVPGGDDEMIQAMQGSDVGLAVSGTVTLEAAFVGLPLVVGYKAGWMTGLIVKWKARVRYVSIPNIILDKEAIPELLFGDCTAEKVGEALRKLLSDPTARETQVATVQTSLNSLYPSSKNYYSPSSSAADAILNTLKRLKKIS